MAEGDQQGKPISLFYSYSHKDEELRNELGDHLFALERAGLIEVWHDRQLLPGDIVDVEIAQKIKTADIVLVLLSPSFIKSSYCYETEFRAAIDRHNRGDARVVPVILRPCQWRLTPLGALLATPTDGRPVTEWANRDSAFNDVAEQIAKLAEQLVRARAARQKPEADASAASATTRTTKHATTAPAPAVDAIPDFAVFRDLEAPWCPEMVALPAGEFLMGSPENEEERDDPEGPQHRVTIGYRFGIGRTPVTVGEYRGFVEATARRHDGGIHVWTGSNWKQDAAKSWSNPGFAQTDCHPVVGVSWKDALAYCEWLAKDTGQTYRLPSEAEWEYACRAGTTTRYWWGDQITPEKANYAESKLGKTTEVGAYPPNPWGLYDMHGNVWQWVEDVWHVSYQKAPADGSGWTEGDGKESARKRVYRGGSWLNIPRYCRSAHRSRNVPNIRFGNRGFRVARTLF